VVAGGAVVDGAPVDALLDQSLDASMVVIGMHQTRQAGVPITTRIAMHASCPVVVVPAGYEPSVGGGVAVGVDGSLTADLAAGFAFDEAEYRGVRLAAVRAWTPPGGRLDTDLATLEAAERRALAASVDHWRPEYPSVDVDYRVVVGSPADGLLAATADTQLLVIGSRGLGEIRALLLGSVGMQVLHRARCPVAVVHPHGHAAGRVVSDHRRLAAIAAPALA